MTDIEVRVDDALGALKRMRGALMIISEANQTDAEDYQGLCGQISAYSHIAEEQLESLGEVIKSLSEVAPKEVDE
jgi:hypothetical protein